MRCIQFILNIIGFKSIDLVKYKTDYCFSSKNNLININIYSFKQYFIKLELAAIWRIKIIDDYII